MAVMRTLLWLLVAAGSIASSSTHAGSSPLTSGLGSKAIIPGWLMKSSKGVTNIEGLARVGVDDSDWYEVKAPTTVFAGLLGAGVYDENKLFYSDNLQKTVDYSAFSVPWLFRDEFVLDSKTGQHFFLRTNGVTSKADIYVNGAKIVSNKIQAGAYGGHQYDISSSIVAGQNCILVTAYPTNYNRDFAMGFVDWNPYPPDNGTGPWRPVEIAQTGPVVMSAPRVLTDFNDPEDDPVTATIKFDLQNIESDPLEATVSLDIAPPDGSRTMSLEKTVKLRPGEQKTISLDVEINNPQIWWPAQWGEQPLYKVTAEVTVDDEVSDIASVASFGIRKVTQTLNKHNDTQFMVNNRKFLVLGAGYSSDLFYRFDDVRVKNIFQNTLDMGLNTIRLEGKQEQPEMYDLADRLGLMILAGWECCDKWEAWPYAATLGIKWSDADYQTANVSMLHEAAMMQSHPSMLGFLIGSDNAPDDRATGIYLDALKRMDWPNPILAAANSYSYSKRICPSGMKEDVSVPNIPLSTS